METIYYGLDAKRLTICGEAAGRRASGGQETVCYVLVPRPRHLVMPAGRKVVDFTAYRRVVHPGEYAPREGVPSRPRPIRWRRTLALIVDLATIDAVVVLLATVVLRFFAGQNREIALVWLRTPGQLCTEGKICRRLLTN